MIRTPQELSTPIKMAVDRKAVVISHILLAVVIAIHTLLDPRSLPFHIFLAFSLSATLITLSLFRFFDLAKVNNRPVTYLVVYQLFCFLGISFISDPATPYAVGIFIVVFLMNLYYGSKGVWITVLMFGVTSVAKYIYLLNTDGLSTLDSLNIFVTFIVFLATCSFFVNIQKVYDWDRSRLKESLEEAVVGQKRLQVLVNSMTESILVLDKNGIVKLYNAATLLLLNTNFVLTNKPLEQFANFENEKGVPVAVLDLLPQDLKPFIRSDVSLRYSADDKAALSIITTPIRASYGHTPGQDGFIVTIRDITKEKSLEDERNEFISIISHELRTPATVVEAGISNSIMLVERNKESSKVLTSLNSAHDQSLYLAGILNDLTTFARAEAGSIEFDAEEFSINDLLNTLHDEYTKQVEPRGMFIAIANTLDPSTTLWSNKLYVKEILQNFITNAIKYSDKGTITITPTVKNDGILFSVADQGIGISISDQKKVFEKFYRAEDFRTRASSGTGLGLYIVKKLAAIIGASFELSSTVGVGSVFSVFVPNKPNLKKVELGTVPSTVTTVAPVSAPINITNQMPAVAVASPALPVTPLPAQAPAAVVTPPALPIAPMPVQAPLTVPTPLPVSPTVAIPAAEPTPQPPVAIS